ncbi:MAG TPA: ABC transporter ATP-binding protein [Candidatus Dormibacteraeota bacterium]|nr:ABC transporter ATP-binding protein [Candidatus Dormibacteraeota bacterium]
MAAVQLIEVQGLTKYYDSRPAIVDLTFSVPRGQVVGFVGPTGAGKSTMMRILTGYLSATSGSAWVAGYSVFEQSRETRKSIGYLPESAQLYNEMSVESYMHTMCRLRGVSPRKRRPRIDHALTVCGLTERRRDIIGHLSNGLRRRVGLAQALVHDPQVLLLDEPGASLDSTQTHETLQLIRALGDQRTVVLSSQTLSEVGATYDRVLLINDGRLIADDAPSSLSRRLAGKRRRQVEAVIAGDPVAVDRQLRKLAGVSEVTVTSNGDGENRLTVTGDGDDLQDAVARVIVGQGLSLRHLNSRSLALEVTLPELAAQEAR